MTKVIFFFAALVMIDRSPNHVFNHLDQDLLLSPDKLIYWKQKKTLICSDLHLGKVKHFRKEGIGVPHNAEHQTLLRLEKAMMMFNPEKVMFLGDLFHSSHNLGWVMFNDFIERHQKIDFILVLGNHDILNIVNYNESRLEVVNGYLESGPYIFTHEPLEEILEGKYNICGHLHPAVMLRGKARQRIKLPCFYFGDRTGILPAIGTFTGTSIINPLKGEKVFVIAQSKVVAI